MQTFNLNLKVNTFESAEQCMDDCEHLPTTFGWLLRRSLASFAQFPHYLTYKQADKKSKVFKFGIWIQNLQLK